MTNKNITISFDMDGTLNSFYSVANWLDYLMNEDATPYLIAQPRINFSLLARYLNKLQKQGYKIQIISWLCKNGSFEFNERTKEVKQKWLKKHLPSVHWDSIKIIEYGSPKNQYCYSSNDILFDDEKQNVNLWNTKGKAFDEKNILEILQNLLTK